MRDDQRPLLAASGVLVSVGAAISGTVSPVVALISAAALPVVILRAPRWSAAVQWTAGLAFLLYAADLPSAVHGHDIRYALADLLFATAGLHAARLQTTRDHLVALGIQLAILTSCLSQLTPDGNVRVGAPAWVAGWLALALPQLSRAAEPRPQRVVAAGPRAPGSNARRYGVLAAVAALTMLLFTLVPTGSANRHLSFGGGGTADSGTGAASSGGSTTPGTGASRVGLSTGAMNLRQRGADSNREVLAILGPPALYRATVFDHYDGTTFSTTGPAGGDYQPDAGTITPPVPADAGDVSGTSQIIVQLLAPANQILSVGQPLSVTRQEGDAFTVSADAHGDLTSGQLPAGTQYLSVGGVPGPGAAAGAAPPDASTWLQLPAELPQRVRDLAKTWTAGASTPAAAVAAIEQHLRTDGFTYNLDSPVPAKGEDAVDDVLFNSKQGFCEQYAATTTVLLRSLGFPARVVAGYAYGEDAGSGERLVRDSDAHAWVEYWSPGAGWATADPTAGIPLGASKAVHHRTPVWVWIALGALLLAGLLVWMFRARLARLFRRTTAPAGAPQPEQPVLQPVSAAWADLLDALAAAGEPRRPEELPSDVLLRIPGGWDARAAILPALDQELWGPTAPDPAATGAAIAAIGALAAGVRAAMEPAPA